MTTSVSDPLFFPSHDVFFSILLAAFLRGWYVLLWQQSEERRAFFGNKLDSRTIMLLYCSSSDAVRQSRYRVVGGNMD